MKNSIYAFLLVGAGLTSCMKDPTPATGNQIFSQDFQSSVNVVDYFNFDSTPNNHQFNLIGIEGTSTAIITEEGQLHFTNYANSNNTCGFVRSTDLQKNPKVIKLEFDFSATPTTEGISLLFFGSEFEENIYEEIAENMHMKLVVSLTSGEGYRFVDPNLSPNPNPNASPFTDAYIGKNHITLYVNGSAEDFTYTRLGASTTLMAGGWDLWINDTLGLHNRVSESGSNELTDFKLNNDDLTGELLFDNFSIINLTP